MTWVGYSKGVPISKCYDVVTTCGWIGAPTYTLGLQLARPWVDKIEIHGP